MNVTGSSSLMQKLKQETRAQHEAVERESNLVGSDLTLVSLRGALEAFHAFLGKWEPLAATSLERHMPNFFETRRKTGLIQRDLAALCRADLTPTAPWNVSPTTTLSIERLARWPGVLGAMYVVEGSTLGGQIVAREIEQRLGLSGGRGYSYFIGYGAETGQMWREFAGVVNATDANEMSQVTAAAIETFATIRGLLRCVRTNG